MRLECAVAIPEQDGNKGGIIVRANDQVRFSVVVEIGRGHGRREYVHGDINVGAERAVAISKEDRNRAIRVVGNGQVRLAVTVEVTDTNGQRFCPRSIRNLGPKGAVAVPEQN